MDEFAKLFLSKRVEKGYSQDDIANKLNVTRQAVSKWENGKGMPDVSLIPQIAQILGVSVDELLTGKQPPEPTHEQVVVRETKPAFSKRKLIAILVPILVIAILASTLMGIYIPKAIEANRPPVTDEPDPVKPGSPYYKDIFINKTSTGNGNDYHYSPINKKSYYNLKMQSSSEYSLFITAPKGAKAILQKIHREYNHDFPDSLYVPYVYEIVSEEVIAEFDLLKTVEYTRYFGIYEYRKNERSGESPEDNSKYMLTNVEDDYYALVIDMTACEEKMPGHKVVVKQHIGFEGITVPAGGSYFAALPIPDNSELSIKHYVIKSAGIKYISTYQLTQNNLSEHKQLKMAAEPLSDFYVLNYEDDSLVRWRDLQIGFVNETDEDIELIIEEVPIKEIGFQEEVTMKGNGIENYCTVFKLTLEEPTNFMCSAFSESGLHQYSILVTSEKYPNVRNFTNFISSERKDWDDFYQTTSFKEEGVIYLFVYSKESDVQFIATSKT